MFVFATDKRRYTVGVQQKLYYKYELRPFTVGKGANWFQYDLVFTYSIVYIHVQRRGCSDTGWRSSDSVSLTRDRQQNRVTFTKTQLFSKVLLRVACGQTAVCDTDLITLKGV